MDDVGLLRFCVCGTPVGSKDLCLAICRSIRTGDSERYGTVFAYIGNLLSGIGTALHSVLYHSGSRIH